MTESVKITPLTCTAIKHPGHFHPECGSATTLVCGYCGEGVCILCSDSCYECAVPLHDSCREDHAKETKHQLDLPIPVTPEAQALTALEARAEKVLEILDCEECGHSLGLHFNRYGCCADLGDREGDESGPAQARGDCGCKAESLSDDGNTAYLLLRDLRQTRILREALDAKINAISEIVANRSTL